MSRASFRQKRLFVLRRQLLEPHGIRHGPRVAPCAWCTFGQRGLSSIRWRSAYCIPGRWGRASPRPSSARATTCCGFPRVAVPRRTSGPPRPVWRPSPLSTRWSFAASMIVSVCPPHVALDVAQQVATTAGRFGGIYLDANAISPATAEAVFSVVTGAGAQYLDGGVIGAPPRPGRHSTRLYLSGTRRVGRCGTVLDFGARRLRRGRVTHGRLGVEDGLRGVDEGYCCADSGHQGHGCALRGR